MTHAAFITSLARSIGAHGAAATLATLRAERPLIAGRDFHDTQAVFYVWAVERLVDGGLSEFGILWHPLVDESSILAWYPIDTLRTTAAANGFVPSPLALAHEPQPAEPVLANA